MIQSAKGLRGKRVLVRAGLNVPLSMNARVVDDYRITRALHTIRYLQKKGAKVIIVSHIGRRMTDTLRPVANYLNRHLNTKVGFAPDILDPDLPEIIANMKNGSVLLLENLRTDQGEVCNDKAFAKYLASLGDVYVNDAFSVSHRKHASITGIPKHLPSYAGLQLQDEVKYLSKALEPKHPFLFIVGGAKIATKMPLLKKFTSVADDVFVGGALAHSIFVELDIAIGRSLLDTSGVKGIQKLAQNARVHIPLDVVVEEKDGRSRNKKLEDIKKTDRIVDAGKETRLYFEELLSGKKLIVFNGTLGDYEHGHGKATKHLLHLIAESSATTIVGGGDTVTLVRKMKREKDYTFVSTGGGAMLDFLADGKLPGIDALIKCKHK